MEHETNEASGDFNIKGRTLLEFLVRFFIVGIYASTGVVIFLMVSGRFPQYFGVALIAWVTCLGGARWALNEYKTRLIAELARLSGNQPTSPPDSGSGR